MGWRRFSLRVNFLRGMQLPYSYHQKSDFGRSVALGAEVAPGRSAPLGIAGSSLGPMAVTDGLCDSVDEGLGERQVGIVETPGQRRHGGDLAGAAFGFAGIRTVRRAHHGEEHSRSRLGRC